jgi:hypothetical protein
MSKILSNKIIFFIFLFILFSFIYSLNNNNIDAEDYSNKIHLFTGKDNDKSFLGDVFDDDDDEFITIDKNCNITEFPEQAIKCNNLTHMECKDKKYLHHCSCKPGYITYPKDNEYYCNLEQKKQSIAFILEFCVGFGAGHFYRHHYKMGGLKLAGFILGIVFICTFPITAKCISDCDCDCLAILLSIIYYLYMCGLAVWYIWDLVYFGKNKYKDYTYQKEIGEVIPLKHW